MSTNIKPIPCSNGAGYRNPEIARLCSRAAGTIDPARRQRLYADIQASLTDEVPYWWLVETDLLRAHRGTIRGLRAWAGDLLEQAWMEAERP